MQIMPPVPGRHLGVPLVGDVNPLPLRLVRLKQLAAGLEVDARPTAVLRRTGDDPGGGAGHARGGRGVGDRRRHSTQGGRRLRRELLHAGTCTYLVIY